MLWNVSCVIHKEMLSKNTWRPVMGGLVEYNMLNAQNILASWRNLAEVFAVLSTATPYLCLLIERDISKSRFNHCGTPVKLVQAGLSTVKVWKCCFNTHGGLVKPVQFYLTAMKARKTIFEGGAYPIDNTHVCTKERYQSIWMDTCVQHSFVGIPASVTSVEMLFVYSILLWGYLLQWLQCRQCFQWACKIPSFPMLTIVTVIKKKLFEN